MSRLQGHLKTDAADTFVCPPFGLHGWRIDPISKTAINLQFREATMKRASRALAIVVLSLTTLAGQTASVHAAETKWFVLRHQTTSNCWTAKLIRIGGQFARASGLIAAGPYTTEEEALSRMAELVLNGTCREK